MANGTVSIILPIARGIPKNGLNLETFFSGRC